MSKPKGAKAPNQLTTMNTRKYPRTMTEAFGPYTNNVLHPINDRKEKLRTYIEAAVVLAIFAGIGVMLAWRG